MKTYEPDHDFGRFSDWFGNARDYVDIDIEKIQDDKNLGLKNNDLPFSEEDLEIWQKAGLIKISEVVLNPDNFKPYQRIIVRCPKPRTPYNLRATS